MKKIDFKSLPDTSTPLNPKNLNQLQTNVEEAINEVDNKFNYSTEEIVVGTWFGRNRYGKLIQFNTPSNITNNSVTINVSDLNIDNLTGFFGVVIDQSGVSHVILGDTQSVTLSADKRQMVIWFNNSSAKSYTGEVVIKYTKTTD